MNISCDNWLVSFLHGTVNLFAAMEVATGGIRGKTTQTKKRADFQVFMDKVVAEQPADRQIHVILGNLNTHKKNESWIAAHPNVTFHFTPTSASWLNQVDIWFGILQRKTLSNASLRSIEQLVAAIHGFTSAYNENAAPFVWRKREVRVAQPRNTIVNFRNRTLVAAANWIKIPRPTPTIARCAMQEALFIRAEWDDKASVWAAASDDVPGLATEADTLEALPQVGRPGALTSGSQGMPECWRYPLERLARKHAVAHGIPMPMGSSFTPELIRPLRQAGCKFERPGKGEHDIRFPSVTGVRSPVAHKIKSRHTANAVLKQAGLPRGG